jgi:FkbM family methyltransferase
MRVTRLGLESVKRHRWKRVVGELREVFDDITKAATLQGFKKSAEWRPLDLAAPRDKGNTSEGEKAVQRWSADGGDYAMRFSYDLNRDSLVLDLGGYQGQWTSDLFSRFCCKIEVFEPVAAFAQHIRERFRYNDSVRVHQYGLGGSTRTEVMGLSADSSSLFRELPQTEAVQIIDVAEWFDRESIGCVGLMKINIEGAEYELLERLVETDLIRRIESIQVQFHEIRGDSAARMEAIQTRLSESHVPTYQYRFVWENWRRK